jgi:hypothetical protein
VNLLVIAVTEMVATPALRDDGLPRIQITVVILSTIETLNPPALSARNRCDRIFPTHPTEGDIE